MVVDLSDWRHQELFAHGIYEPHVTALVARIARPGWTVIDVGANVGYFASLASHVGGADAKVHAFEPHPRMASIAEINARMNERVSYTVIRAACGAETQRRTLYLARVAGNIGESTFIDPGSVEAPTAMVDVLRLDDHCEHLGLTPHLVKIDVEGSELLVLEGMERLLIERVPKHLIVEVGGEPKRPSPDIVVDRLMTFGYEPMSITPAGQLVAYVMRRELQDVCFVRRGESGAQRRSRGT
jgi:FkbM family methyltransferase